MSRVGSMRANSFLPDPDNGLILRSFPQTILSQLTDSFIDPDSFFPFNNNFGVEASLAWIYQAVTRVKDWRLKFSVNYNSFNSGGGLTETFNLTGGFEYVMKSIDFRNIIAGSSQVVSDEIFLVSPSVFSLSANFYMDDSSLENMSLSGSYSLSPDGWSGPLVTSDSSVNLLANLLGIGGPIIPAAIFDDRSVNPIPYNLGTKFWFMCNLGIPSDQTNGPSLANVFYSDGSNSSQQGIPLSASDPNDPTMDIDEGLNKITLTSDYSSTSGGLTISGESTVSIEPETWWTNGGMYDPSTGLPV